MVLLCEAVAPDHTGAPAALCVSGGLPEALLEITRPEVNLAVWHRRLPAALRPGCSRLARAAPFRAAVEGTPESAVDALAAALPCPAPLDLLVDIRALALLFAALAGTQAVQLRLEGVDDDSCRHYHADAIGLRLLCTYRGAGTQWLPLAGAAAARALRQAPLPAPHCLPMGAVALLKGDSHPSCRGAGCVHRSPPLRPRDPARLLLSVDEPGRIPLQ